MYIKYRYFYIIYVYVHIYNSYSIANGGCGLFIISYGIQSTMMQCILPKINISIIGTFS